MKSRSISKSELAEELGVTLKTLAAWIQPWEKELKKRFNYRRKQKILSPAIRDFLNDKLGQS